MYHDCYCKICESGFKYHPNCYLIDNSSIGICSECLQSVDVIDLLDAVSNHIKDMYAMNLNIED